jgi:hypothetical protein
MALRGISWCFDTTTKQVKDSQAVTTEYEKEPNTRIYLTNGTALIQSHTIVTREWLALTQTAAQRVVDCKAVTSNVDTNTSYRMRLENRILNSWVLEQHIDSFSPWTVDT